MIAERASRSRALMIAGALCTALGLAIAAMAPVAGTTGSERTEAEQLSGGVIMIVGWALLAWGIHRFGRESGD